MSRFRLTALTQPHGGGLENAARVAACVLALLSIGAGLIHVTAAADHQNLPLMMAGFLVVATLQVALGGIVLWRRPGRALLAVGMGVMAGSLVIWLVSRTAGLPFLPGGHMEPIGFKDGVAKLFEVGAIGAALLLTSSELPNLRLPSPRLGTQTVAALGAGMFVLSVPALVLGGGEHHSASQHARMGGHEDGVAHAGGGHEDGVAHAGGGHEDGVAHAGGGHEDGAGGRTAGAHHAGGGGARHAGGAGHREHTSGVLGDRAHGGGGDAHRRAGHGDDRRHAGGGHGDTGGGDGHRRAGHGDDRRHAGGGHGGDSDGAHAGAPHDGHGGDEPPREGIAFESGKPGQGSAIVWRGKSSGSEGPGHHGESAPCSPSADQRSAAERLVRDTRAALRVYDNNPAKALADGFYYAFGPTDRTMHMVAPGRVDEPAVLQPNRIESFLYAMTDDGWVAIGGMYIMPEYGMPGPEVGGCMTKWHHHGGFGGRLATAGTMEKTPEMLHVWTYRGLEPFGHYDGRDFSQLFGPAAALPSFCRQFGDASDVCLP